MNVLDRFLQEPYEKAAIAEEKRQADIEAEADALMAEWSLIEKASEYVDNYELLLEERKFIVSDVAVVLALVTRGELTKDSAATYLGNQVINKVKACALKIAQHHVEGSE